MTDGSERKAELVGKGNVKVEFTIDELVNQALFGRGRGVSVASCGGCNGCKAKVAAQEREDG